MIYDKRRDLTPEQQKHLIRELRALGIESAYTKDGMFYCDYRNDKTGTQKIAEKYIMDEKEPKK